MDLNAIPRLSPGCRLHPTEAVLLVPEGALNLHGPAHDILAQLDGKRSIAAVLEELRKQYSGVDADVMREHVLALLERMVQRGVVRV